MSAHQASHTHLNELKAQILDCSTDAVIAHTIDGRLVYFNDAAAEQYGYTRDEFEALGPYGWVPDAELANHPARVDLIREHGSRRFPSHGAPRNGAPVHTEVCARHLVTPDGELIVSIIRDVTERVVTEQGMRHLAFHDRLTGLANRAKLEDDLRVALRSADRHSDLVGVVYLDLDDFKPVNDRLGHAVGDRVLCEVSARMQAAVREYDTVARLGGDEFLALISRMKAREDLAAIARKLAREVERPVMVGEHEIRVTASLGLALYRPGELEEDLTTRADHAMYRAKKAGMPGWEAYLAEG
jgi:diguanylate cyclase (GGDEF)-like protein/PAS domain S-box-containing protein